MKLCIHGPCDGKTDCIDIRINRMALYLFLESVKSSETMVNIPEHTNVRVDVNWKGSEKNFEFAIHTTVNDNITKEAEKKQVTNTHCCHY